MKTKNVLAFVLYSLVGELARPAIPWHPKFRSILTYAWFNVVEPPRDTTAASLK